MDQVVLRQCRVGGGVASIFGSSLVCNKYWVSFHLSVLLVIFYIGLFVPTRLSSHLGKVGHHMHGIAREMAANSVHEALPPFLQRRGSHGPASENSPQKCTFKPKDNRSKQRFPLTLPMACVGGVRETA